MTNNQNVPALNDSPLQFTTEINTAWQLYRDQLQRNFELMKIIGELQMVINQFAAGSVPKIQAIPNSTGQQQPHENQPPPQPEIKINSIPLQRSKQIEQVYRLIDRDIKRTDAVESLIEILYAVHQLEQVSAEKLYTVLAIPESTCYRYIRKLSNLQLLTGKNGKLCLSKAGTLLMNEPLQHVEQFQQLIRNLKSENIYIADHDMFTTQQWFQRQAQKI